MQRHGGKYLEALKGCAVVDVYEGKGSSSGFSACLHPATYPQSPSHLEQTSELGLHSSLEETF